MKFYSYVIPRDFGFAPNPYFGYCTLATCKQGIRKSAHVGDWIGAFGAASMTIRGRLVSLMLVDETLSLMSIGKIRDLETNARYLIKA